MFRGVVLRATIIAHTGNLKGVAREGVSSPSLVNSSTYIKDYVIAAVRDMVGGLARSWL